MKTRKVRLFSKYTKKNNSYYWGFEDLFGQDKSLVRRGRTYRTEKEAREALKEYDVLDKFIDEIVEVIHYISE